MIKKGKREHELEKGRDCGRMSGRMDVYEDKSMSRENEELEEEKYKTRVEWREESKQDE